MEMYDVEYDVGNEDNEWMNGPVILPNETWETEEEEIEDLYYRDLQFQKELDMKYDMLMAARNGLLDKLMYYKRVLGSSNSNMIESVFDNRWGYSVLHMASMGGQLHIVKYLVEECNMRYNIQGNNKEKSTPLQVACGYAQLSIVKYFINHCNADVNKANRYGNTALHRASRNGHLDVVRYLTKDCGDRIDIELTNKKGLTAFHRAVMFSKLNIVQFLAMECHANVEAKDKYGWTPFHVAVLYRSKMTTVQYLIDTCQVDVTTTDNRGRNIFDMLFNTYYKRRNATDYCNDIIVRVLQTMIAK